MANTKISGMAALAGSAVASDDLLAIIDVSLTGASRNKNIEIGELISALQLLSGLTGWAEYQDDQYTSGSPFALSANTDTVLPNNAGVTREGQKPADIATFYDVDNQLIPGRNGDGINVFVYFTCEPATASGNYIDLWLDIGSPVGELYRRTTTFPKGDGVAAGISMSIAGFMLDTWAANGGQVKVRSSVNCDIYDIRYVLTRTHRALPA